MPANSISSTSGVDCAITCSSPRAAASAARPLRAARPSAKPALQASVAQHGAGHQQQRVGDALAGRAPGRCGSSASAAPAPGRRWPAASPRSAARRVRRRRLQLAVVRRDARSRGRPTRPRRRRRVGCASAPARRCRKAVSTPWRVGERQQACRRHAVRRSRGASASARRSPSPGRTAMPQGCGEKPNLISWRAANSGTQQEMRGEQAVVLRRQPAGAEARAGRSAAAALPNSIRLAPRSASSAFVLLPTTRRRSGRRSPPGVATRLRRSPTTTVRDW